MQSNPNIIISGGGTGGHVFPAISIANAILEINPEANILFVGAIGRIEMAKVPAAGFQIIGLPIRGFQRKLSFQNILILFRLIISLIKANRLINRFNPNVVVGVGGYASGPVVRIAQLKKIPTVLQEQNSYAGITNKMLAKKAQKICVAYEGMNKYFPANKIILTGNPVRKDISEIKASKAEGCSFFGLDPSRKTILVIGGSLGARTINLSVQKEYTKLIEQNFQILWQTGSLYYKKIIETLPRIDNNQVKIMDFIHQMDLAFAAADLIISRAGAGTISELCLVGKPVILIPSPNVAEDHQTKNALALVNKEAAMMIKDDEATEKLIDTAVSLLNDQDKMNKMAENIKKLAMKDSAKHIAEEVLKLSE